MVAKEEEGSGKDWACGVNRHKLVHLERINNKVLLCSTENHIQSPEVDYDGKEY